MCIDFGFAPRLRVINNLNDTHHVSEVLFIIDLFLVLILQRATSVPLSVLLLLNWVVLHSISFSRDVSFV